MSSEAYARGLREFTFYGQNYRKNPYDKGSKEFEDYNSGMKQAFNANPSLDERIKSDRGGDEVLTTYKQFLENKKKEAEEAKRKTLLKGRYQRLKDGY